MWLATLVLGFAASGAVGDAFRDEFNLPDVESKTGFDILDDEFGGQGTGQVGTIVFRAEKGVEDPAVQGPMEELFAKAKNIDDVTGVESPYAGEGGRQIASRGPEAGKIAYANIELPDDIDFGRAGEIRDEILKEAPEGIDGLRIELGG
ncbi:MAG: MMPL family transporter, partial [Acidimicrobiales bacterium]